MYEIPYNANCSFPYFDLLFCGIFRWIDPKENFL